MKYVGTIVLGFGAVLVGASAVAAQQVVDLSQTSQPSGSAFQWIGPSANAQAGAKIFRADMNGDINRLDLLAGAPGAGPAGQGRVFIVYIGPPQTGNVSLNTADVIATGENAGDQFGTAAGAGFILSADVAGARYQDLVVGAPNAYGGNGAVYLFPAPSPGSSLSASADARLKIVGRAGDRLGDAVAVADLDGDGYRDIIMAAPGSGKVYVLFGAPSIAGTVDLSTNPSYVMTMATGVAGTITFATADFNADGRKDVAIGSPGSSGSAGAVFLVFGRAGRTFPSSAPATPFSLATYADASAAGITAGDQAGAALTTGDFDGDSTTDLVIGAPGASPLGRTYAGAVYVLWGGPGIATSRSLAAADVTIAGAIPAAHLGAAMSAGYIRRDLQADLALLATGGSTAGDIDVVYGGLRRTIPPVIDLAGGINRVVRADPAGAPLTSVLVLEDTGEGAQDILAGAPMATAGGNANAGIVYNAYSPTLQVSPATTSASVAQGATQTVAVNVTNIGTTTVHWAVRSNSPWLSISPATGTSSATAPGVLTLTLAPGSLPAGQTYNGGFSVVSTDRDLIWSTTGSVNLTVTPGSTSGPTPTNPGGIPVSPDEGAPGGVFTAAGTNITVVPVAGVTVTFTNVVSSGHTTVQVTNAVERSDNHVIWGPWDFQISTDAVFSGPVTIGIVYDASLIADRRGVIRIVSNGQPLRTVGLDATSRYILATASGLPVKVAVENDLRNDFNADGYGDLIWRRASDGALASWFMNGSNLLSAAILNPPSVGNTDWTVVGSGDFNGDGRADLLWWNSVTGALGVWFMNGSTMTSVANLSPNGVADTTWKVVGVGDIDGDGQPDLLWRNETNGLLAVWYLNGVNLRGVAMLNPSVVADLTWKIVGVGDFNGDGHPDLLWRNDTSGQLGVWFMNGVNLTSVAMLNPSSVADFNWQVVAVVDLDGDGQPDVVWENMSTGAIGAWFMNGLNMQSVRMLGPGAVVPGWKVVTGR